MPALYHRLPEPVPVAVTVRGQPYPDGVYPGMAEGWRGRRVYVLLRCGVGANRFEWVDASAVRRRSSYRPSATVQ